MKHNIFNFTLNELEAFMADNFPKSKPYHSKEIFKWIYGKREHDFSNMSNISKALREKLSGAFDFGWSSLEKVEVDPVDGTKKLLINLYDGNKIESVIIPSDKRLTLCVSCQVGCKRACSFCLTGTMKFTRNLEPSEIVAQLRFASEVAMRDKEALAKGEHSITNIVFMGMGEPLDNIESVGKAINIMQDQFAFGYSKRRITVSTCGIPDRLLAIHSWGQPQIAISLHAPNDELRSQLMPINKKHSLESLFSALEKYPLERGRRITFEYALIKDLNDSIEDAKQLLKLVRRVPAKINLLFFNEYEDSPYKSSTRDKALKFQEFLMNSGVQTNLRESRGQNISAACGQLVTKNI